MQHLRANFRWNMPEVAGNFGGRCAAGGEHDLPATDIISLIFGSKPKVFSEQEEKLASRLIRREYISSF